MYPHAELVVIAVHLEPTLYNKLPYQTYTMNKCYHGKKEGGGMCVHTNSQSDTVTSKSQFILKCFLLHSMNTSFTQIGNDPSFHSFQENTYIHGKTVFMSVNVCMLNIKQSPELKYQSIKKVNQSCNRPGVAQRVPRS